MKKDNIQPIFIIIFEDNTKFEGGTSYYETKWNQIPDKKIRNIFYRLPSGDSLCLPVGDKYYHKVEATQDIYGGKNKGKVILRYAYIMVKRGEKVIQYKIQLFNSMYRECHLILNYKGKKIKKITPKNEVYIVKGSEIKAKNLRKGNTISKYNYKDKKMEIMNVIENKIIPKLGDKKIGNISIKILPINSSEIKSLNKENWK